MRTAKHTPGPWVIDTDTSTPNHSTMIRDNQLRQICEINRYLDVKNDLANTRLISAAPEMLEALEDALRLIAVAENNNAFSNCAAPKVGSQAILKLQNIINKARGE